MKLGMMAPVPRWPCADLKRFLGRGKAYVARMDFPRHTAVICENVNKLMKVMQPPVSTSIGSRKQSRSTLIAHSTTPCYPVFFSFDAAEDVV